MPSFSQRSRTSIRRRRSRRGMSLMEVMVVIAIIMTLMSVIGYGVMQIYADAQADMTQLTMNKMSENILIYEMRHKRVPSTGQGLAAVFADEPLPKDSWGNEIEYVSPGPDGSKFDLVSLGADGREGGSGKNSDIVWSKSRR